MKAESLFCRATFVALAFLVFSFNYQYSSFLQVSRSATADQDDGFLRSISNKEDQVLERIQAMGAQLAELKTLHENQKSNTIIIDPKEEARQLAKKKDKSEEEESKGDVLLEKMTAMGAQLADLNKDKLTEKIEQMTVQLAEMKETTDKLAAAAVESPTKPIPSTDAVPVPVTVAGAHMTPIYMDSDPCDTLRSSTSSIAVSTPYGADCRRRFLHELEQQPKPLTVTTIIPGLARDKDFAVYFPKVLKSLQAQTVPSDEVVICISGLFDKLSVRYKHKMKDDFSNSETNKPAKYCSDALESFSKIYTKSPIKLICVGERLSSGRARNAAVSASTSDILAFIDSDDTAYPIRNEVVRNVFNDTMSCRQETDKPPLLLLLHSHKKATWKDHPYEKARGYTLPSTNQVLPGGNWTGDQCLEQEEGLEVQHGRQILATIAGKPTSWAISEEVANGHPVIRRRAFDKVHFSSIPKGQDVILLRDLMFQLTPLEAEHSVLYIKRPLSTYYQVGNANADLRNLDKEKKEQEWLRTAGTTKGATKKGATKKGATKKGAREAASEKNWTLEGETEKKTTAKGATETKKVATKKNTKMGEYYKSVKSEARKKKE